MDHKDNNHSGNGFLFGLLIGVIVTLFFTTKKGRKILRELTDKGLDKVTEFEKAIDEKAKLHNEMEEFEDEESAGEMGDDYVELELTENEASKSTPSEQVVEKETKKETAEKPKDQHLKETVPESKKADVKKENNSIEPPKLQKPKRFFRKVKKN